MAFIVSLGALILSYCAYSNDQAMSATQVAISRTQVAISATQAALDERTAAMENEVFAMSFAARLEDRYFVAHSPDLTDERDRLQLSRHNWGWDFLPTDYYLQAQQDYAVQPDPDHCYLFLMIVNRGQGAATVQILDVLWEPSSATIPATSGLKGSKRVIDSDQFLAILLDMVKLPDLTDPFANAHFKSLKLLLAYTDLSTGTSNPQSYLIIVPNEAYYIQPG